MGRRFFRHCGYLTILYLLLQQFILAGRLLNLLPFSFLLLLLLLLLISQLLNALELLLDTGCLDSHHILDLMCLHLASTLLLDLDRELQFDLLGKGSMLGLGLELCCHLVLDVRQDLLLDPWNTKKLGRELDLRTNLSYRGLGYLWGNSNGGYLCWRRSHLGYM